MVDWCGVYGGPISSYGMGSDHDESSHFDGPDTDCYRNTKRAATQCKYCKSYNVEWTYSWISTLDGSIKIWRLFDKDSNSLHRCINYHNCRIKGKSDT